MKVKMRVFLGWLSGKRERNQTDAAAIATVGGEGDNVEGVVEKAAGRDSDREEG